MPVPSYGFMEEQKHVAHFGQQIIDWKYSCDSFMHHNGIPHAEMNDFTGVWIQ
jgi:hypothetical protein